jgi:hypothetical protein
MNHLQLVALTASFNFEWPESVVRLFDSAKPAAEISRHIISFDCFLDTRRENNDENAIRIYYQKMIMLAILPLFLGICSLIFWSIYYCNKANRPKSERFGRIIATLIILFFLVHPSIVGYMFSNFE